jgi:hypothetical protein
MGSITFVASHRRARIYRGARRRPAGRSSPLFQAVIMLELVALLILGDVLAVVGAR